MGRYSRLGIAQNTSFDRGRLTAGFYDAWLRLSIEADLILDVSTARVRSLGAPREKTAPVQCMTVVVGQGCLTIIECNTTPEVSGQSTIKFTWSLYSTAPWPSASSSYFKYSVTHFRRPVPSSYRIIVQKNPLVKVAFALYATVFVG